MNKTTDVINWYHCQSSAVSTIHETLNLNNHKQKTSDIVERKMVLKQIRYLCSYTHYKLSYLQWNQFLFLFLFTCRKFDYKGFLVYLASWERRDKGVVPKMRPLTSRQTWIITFFKGRITKQMSKYGYFVQAMAWTFLHPTFQQNTIKKLYFQC